MINEGHTMPSYNVQYSYTSYQNDTYYDNITVSANDPIEAHDKAVSILTDGCGSVGIHNVTKVGIQSPTDLALNALKMIDEQDRMRDFLNQECKDALDAAIAALQNTTR
jgi:hypothetical protein